MIPRTVAVYCSVVLMALLVLPGVHAQKGPTAGKAHTVIYNPAPGGPFGQSPSLTLYYAFDYWNVRYGTRLALWQNVLRPDTSRVRSVAMDKVGEAWKAVIPIPGDAALFSWLVSDGNNTDGNNEKTYVEYVLGDDGKPVQNARYFNVQFLRLAGSELGTMVMEMERELADYPENFPAYHQYFSLLIEQAKGSERIQERIANRIAELEKSYASNDDFLNLAAQTWFYLLQDQKRGLEYREKISLGQHWPQVLRMFDREGKEAEQSERQIQSRNRRDQLRGNPLPEFNLKTVSGEKSGFPRRNGRPLILLYWASTSERSLNLIDDIRNMMKATSSEAVDVVFTSVDPEEERAVATASQRGFEANLLLNQGSALQILGVDSLPTLFLVDSNDVIRTIHVGYSSAQVEEVRAFVESLGK